MTFNTIWKRRVANTKNTAVVSDESTPTHWLISAYYHENNPDERIWVNKPYAACRIAGHVTEWGEWTTPNFVTCSACEDLRKDLIHAIGQHGYQTGDDV